ncbi:hypothetical protein HDU93_008561 [Gonapodya sp. JEL0774]|nr:hypothetical protein HDU93_008561 [Gonapodya sp. JEL0774]
MSGPGFQWNSVEEMVARVGTESLLSFESEYTPEFVFLLGRSDDFDAPVTVISEDMKTFSFRLFQTSVPSSVAGASILSKRLEDSRGQRLWANEDLTPNTTTESVPSNAELTEFVNLVESVLVAVDEDFG